MKAAVVLATSTGGIGTHVLSLVRRLPGLGVDVTVLCPEETEQRFAFSAAGSAFVPVEISSGPRLRADAAAVGRLRATLSGTDVVHAHGLRAAAIAGFALGRRRPGRTPCVATWHNAVLVEGARRRALLTLEMFAARRADITLGASSDLVERARRLGAPHTRLAPVAAPAMRPARRPRMEVRAELGATDRPLVLAVGRLAPQKDYDTLLRAVAGWGQREPQPLVAVAGSGPEHDRLQRIIDGRGLAVRLLGHRDDVADLLAASDVYLLTSRWEARALVVQEAMRAGVPVVATAVGGVPELVGDAAVLVTAGDAEAVAREVVRLLDDENRRQDLAGRGRARAATWPDEDDVARQVAAVYAEVSQS